MPIWLCIRHFPHGQLVHLRPVRQKPRSGFCLTICIRLFCSHTLPFCNYVRTSGDVTSPCLRFPFFPLGGFLSCPGVAGTSPALLGTPPATFGDISGAFGDAPGDFWGRPRRARGRPRRLRGRHRRARGQPRRLRGRPRRLRGRPRSLRGQPRRARGRIPLVVSLQSVFNFAGKKPKNQYEY